MEQLANLVTLTDPLWVDRDEKSSCRVDDVGREPEAVVLALHQVEQDQEKDDRHRKIEEPEKSQANRLSLVCYKVFCCHWQLVETRPF